MTETTKQFQVISVEDGGNDLFQIYGRDETGAAVVSTVNGFEYKLYASVESDDVDVTEVGWNEYCHALSKRIGNIPVSAISFCRRRNFYGFVPNDGKTDMICIHVASSTDMKRLRSAFHYRRDDGGVKLWLERGVQATIGLTVFDVIEPEISFSIHTGILPFSWLAGVTTATTHWKQFQLVTSRSDISQILVMSFDIECVPLLKNEFPKPESDPVVAICVVFYRMGDAAPFRAECMMTFSDSVNTGTMPSRERVYAGNGSASINDTTVTMYYSELAMLYAFADLIRTVDPDILTGYNTDGFDWPFLLNRESTLSNGTLSTKGLHYIGRGHSAVVYKAPRADSQYKSGKLEIKGRILYDTILVVKNERKLRSYKLSVVSEELLRDDNGKPLDADVAKDDVKYYELDGLWRSGFAKDRERLLHYCLRDAVLPLRILLHQRFIVNGIGMSKIMIMPMGWLYTRGVSRREYAIIFMNAIMGQYAVPVINTKGGGGADAQYMGAIVLAPQIGYYGKDLPIAVLDFNSLYPSIIIARNMCYTTWVRPDLVAAYEKAGIVMEKSPSGHYFVKASVRKGIVPLILEMLIAKRNQVKGEMKVASNAKNMVLYAVLDGLQLAIKTAANAMYGFTGLLNGPLPLLAIAESTTAWGRDALEQSKVLVESRFTDAKVVYGDSVVESTPILLRYSDMMPECEAMIVRCMELESVAKITRWYRTKLGKEVGVPGIPVETWTGEKWTRVHQIIRHCAPGKEIYRVSSMCRGIVDVTADHSLILDDGKRTPISPLQLLQFSTYCGQAIVPSLLHASSMPYQITDFGMDIVMRNLQKRQQQGPLEITTASDYEAAFHFRSMIVQFGVENVCAVWNRHSGKYHIGRVLRRNQARLNVVTISRLRVLDDKEYVYDLTTEDHVFQAGVGTLIVHNTDSLFVLFGGGKRAITIPEAIESAETAAKMITALFPPPQKTVLEKLLCPLLLVSKKRYAAMKIMANALDKRDLYTSGTEDKRRDIADFITKAVRTLILLLMTDGDTSAVEYIKKLVTLIHCNELPVTDYVITKELTKSVDKYSKDTEVTSLIRKKTKRDESTVVNVGNRYEYVIIQGMKGQSSTSLAEDVDVVIAKGLPINRDHYLHLLDGVVLRLMTPVLRPPRHDVDSMTTEEQKRDKAERMDAVRSILFRGDHARKRVIALPKSGGLLDYFSPIKKK